MGAVALLATMGADALAQGKPEQPANLQSSVDYNKVELSWSRSTQLTTLLAEDFEAGEFPPTGWTVKTKNQNDPIFTWFHYPTADFEEMDDWTSWVRSGTKSAVVYMDMNAPYDDGTSAEQSEWLMLPPTKGAAYLDFYCFIDPTVLSYGAYEDFGDHYYVKASHDGGTTWQTLWDARYDSNGSTGWQRVSLYLGDTASDKETLVAFHAQSKEGDADESLYFAWVIDDVALASTQSQATPTESFNVYLDGELIAGGLKSCDFTDESDKQPGQHTYKICAYSAATQQESEPVELTVTIKEAPCNPPTNVQVTSTYDETADRYAVSVTWEAPEGDRQPIHYTVYANNALVGDYLPLGEGLEQTGLFRGVYDYTVTAVYESPDGESAGVGDQVALGTRFPARSLKVAGAATGGTVLNWAAPKPSDHQAVGYKVYRGNTLLGETASLTLSDPAAPQGLYEYSVCAVYDDGFVAVPVRVAYDNGGVQTCQLPFSEDFTGGMKPANWQVQKLRAAMKDDYLWRFDNWFGVPVSGGGFDGDFASVNSIYSGYGRVTTRLATPPLQATGLGDGDEVTLDFDMDLNEGSSTRARLEYSTDGGANWETFEALAGYTDEDLEGEAVCSPEHIQMDVTSLFASGDKVMLGWYYNGLQSQHLAIDNVRVAVGNPAGIGGIADNDPDGSRGLAKQPTRVSSLDGRTVRSFAGGVPTGQATDGLQPGLYIVNGRKVAVKP